MMFGSWLSLRKRSKSKRIAKRTIHLESLPDRDSPSSIDVAGVANFQTPATIAQKAEFDRPWAVKLQTPVCESGRTLLLPQQSSRHSVDLPRSSDDESFPFVTKPIQIDWPGSTLPPTRPSFTYSEPKQLPPPAVDHVVRVDHSIPPSTEPAQSPVESKVEPWLVVAKTVKRPHGLSVASPDAPTPASPLAMTVVSPVPSAPAFTVVTSVTPSPVGVSEPITSDDSSGFGSGTGGNAIPPSEPPLSVVDPGSSAGPTVPPIVINPVVSPVTPPTIQASTPLFTCHFQSNSAEARDIGVTLSAHDSSGTVSIRQTISVTANATTTIVPGATLAGRTPDLMTITLSDMGTRGPATATRFLTAIPQIGDSALFEAHRVARSSEAFGALVKRHEGMVIRVSQQIVGNRADAQDVGQLVFLELARFSMRFPGSLSGWLRTVSRNASLTLLRARKRRQRYESAAARPVEIEDLMSDFDDTLEQAIRQLPFDQAHAVRLRYMDGFSQKEAAKIAGCPRGTLARRAAVGLETLRILLGVREQENGERHWDLQEPIVRAAKSSV